MSEQVMVLGKVNKGIRKTSSVQDYESTWLGHWSQSHESKSSKDLIRPEDIVKENHGRKSGKEGVEVSPFPMFNVSQKRDSTTKLQAYPVLETKPLFDNDVGSSSKSMANRMPWIYAQGEKDRFSTNTHLEFPIQEKTTQNLLELIRPTRIYANGDSLQRVSREMNLLEEDSHQLMKESKAPMKLKGKVFGGYLDLFPNIDHCHKGGAKLLSLESLKDTEEDGPRKHDSSAETDTLEMDRLQMKHLSGSISSSSTKVLFNPLLSSSVYSKAVTVKGRRGDSVIIRTEIPDMNEEPPPVLDEENSIDEHLGETSNSATQCMNVDQFLPRECKRVRLEPELEPGSRWVKRLKTKASDSSGHDVTKSLMKSGEASQGQKGNNNLFLEILKSGTNNLQPINQELVTSQIKNLDQGGEDVTLTHPWIQRWCKKKASLTDQSGGQEVGFETKSQKELEKKQYPSIAAMALMGKALSGLNPHGLRKTNSITVWNAQDIR